MSAKCVSSSARLAEANESKSFCSWRNISSAWFSDCWRHSSAEKSSNFCSFFWIFFVFVDNIFPCSSTGLLMAHELMNTDYCPIKIVMMSEHATSEYDPLITKIHKKLLDTKTVRTFIIQAGISHQQIRKMTTIHNTRRTIRKDPRPKRVRQLNP